MSPENPEITRQEAEAQYAKGANAELAKEYGRAFRHYVKAAEQYVFLNRQATDEQLRTHYRAQAAKALERAEKIKSVRRDVRPVAKDDLSESDQLYVLQKSSFVNQGYMPLWDSTERPTPASEQPPLSDEQRERGATWRKPEPTQYRAFDDDPTGTLLPQDIVQHVVTDCSVCGAIAVCIDHHRRFGSKMIVNSLYPQEDSSGSASTEPSEYHFKILYNGGYRRVGIDDHLPMHPDGRLMCMSTGNKRLLWPSLVEKAYIKLAGGYDFVGSDSSTDLHALAGWIPEHIDMRSSEFQPEKTWSRVTEGYQLGYCMLTLGTGERLPEANFPIPLLPAHCYAVIGVARDDHRRVTIFDPWAHSQTEHEGYEDTAGQKRVAEISWDEVRNLFDGLYLSWNPKLFKHQISFHGQWKRHGAKGDTGSSHFRGQLRLESNGSARSDESVWLQLTRHVRSHRRSPGYISLSMQSGSEVSSSNSVELLSTKGQYTSSPHMLVRTSVSPDELVTFIASCEGDHDDLGFTVTAYSDSKISWVHSPPKPPYSRDIEGAFTHKSAGGNHTYPSYYLNPQYHVRIHPRASGTQQSARETKTHLSVSLRTDRSIPTTITLAWSQGERINELGHSDLALSSGPYSYGFALASGRVPPGDYTLIVSAFEPRHLGKFDLSVESSERFEVTPIPQEGAGMFRKMIKGDWDHESAAGAPSFGKYSANPAYEIRVPTTSHLQFRLQLAKSSPTASLNLTIFDASIGMASNTHIATSGPYSDARSGVVIPQRTFQPGRYLAIPSTHSPGIRTDFVLIVYSTVSVEVIPAKRRP
ncbi:cysteine proteinase [Pilatotrama ljubarskyi]|nr:cysteine proteinase [Pilatotrama ljubarskyi]